MASGARKVLPLFRRPRARFVALPVGRGDAFFLQSDAVTVLVDGGQGQRSLPMLFRNYTGLDAVDVLVCTHNDSDHANGVLGFLESGFGCGEVWLPGRWLSGLRDLLATDFVARLLSEVQGAEHRSGVLDSIEQLVRVVETMEQDYPPDHDAASEPLAGDGWPESVRGHLEDASQLPIPLPLYLPQAPISLQLLLSLIEAAFRIRAIAIEAFHRGIPVRWFSYDHHRASGGDARLRPMNGMEISRFHPIKMPLARWLALTIANRESLVFWSPPVDQTPGVLFAADSDFAGIGLDRCQLAQALVTAPHHGSEENREAYLAVGRAAAALAPSIRWVRSDCKSSKRPGPTYCQQPLRACTMCRGKPKRAVQLLSHRGTWMLLGDSAGCSCEPV